MANSQEYSGSELTFAQREGRASLPESMRLEHIPQKFRQLAWIHLENALNLERRYITHHGGNYAELAVMAEIVFSYQFNIQGKFHNAIHTDFGSVRSFIESIVCRSEYHTVLTFIEHILQNTKCPDGLRDALLDAFKVSPIAYVPIGGKNQFIIVPRISQKTGETVIQAFETLQEAGMDGAETHLRHASEHIHNQDYPASIVSSIHSVESVARNIDHASSKTLGPALASLKSAGLLHHSALGEAFQKLYGYTCDEQGLRHALIDRGSANVGLDEAIFMFGACASFAAYLANKHRKMRDRPNGDS